MRGRALAAAGLAVLVALGASSCGGSPTAATSAPNAVTHYVEVGGKRVAVPTEGKYPIGAATGSGTQVIITPTGFEPRVLYSTQGKAITWTNLTNQVQRVTFEYSPVHSGNIAPGHTFSWTPKTLISIRYTSPKGFSGNLLIGVFGH
jgi:hypothetical protein